MASIKRYKTSSGYRYRVQYRSPDGRARTKQGFVKKAEAESWAATNTVSIDGGEWVPEETKKIPVSAFGTQWDAGLTRLKPSSRRVMHLAWVNQVEPVWGSRRVASIRPSEVDSWVAGMQGSASTVRRAHNTLAQILDMAVADRVIRVNPARGVRLPRKEKSVPVFLTVSQVSDLASECSRHGELVWLLATTGLRWGEAAALRVRDVNVLRRRISVERNAVTVGNEVMVGTPKTHERRTVAVTGPVLKKLESVMRGKGPEDLLWSRPDGSPLKLPSVGSWYYEALDRVQSRTKKARETVARKAMMAGDADPVLPTLYPRVTVHGLRHVAAGLLVSSGANVKVVQKQLGHASAAMTLDVYASLFDGDLDEVTDRLETLMEGAV